MQLVSHLPIVTETVFLHVHVISNLLVSGKVF